MIRTLFVALVLAVIAVPAAAEEMWKDGVLFEQEELGTVEGHKIVKIVFGLESGKCTGEIVASAEWLKMREGEMTQSYPGRGEVKRTPGEEWFQMAGTRVNVCNRSNAKAVLVGVQLRAM